MKDARDEANSTGAATEDIALKKLMAEDSEIAQMYQEDFAAEKRSNEIEEKRVDDVHEKFDYFKDQRRMANKVKDQRFDITGELPETEDELFSTEFEIDDMAPEDAELYRRYKLMSYRTKLDEKEMQEQMRVYAQSVRATIEQDSTNSASLRPFWELKAELLDKQFARKAFNIEIESHLAQLRYNNQISKLDVT